MPDRDLESDSLDHHEDNREAIAIIMELYNVNEAIATDLWKHFIETVRKMRDIKNPPHKKQEKKQDDR